MTGRLCLLIVLMMSLLPIQACLPGRDRPDTPLPETEPWEGYGSQTVILFFSEGGLDPTWREELRPIELQEDPVERMARTLEELFRGPERGLGRALPPGAALEHIFLEEGNGTLTLDLSPVTSQILLRAGSIEEQIALEAIKRTLRVNFPALRRLRILVGGRVTETLGGHLNIARPLVIAGEGN
jgi:spore germination protein GerM